MKGKLIVIEGADGSGKKTQADLLLKSLNERKMMVQYMDFPQYSSFYGEIVAKFLRGEFGKIDDVSPYLASLAYALDRASVKEQMESFLEQGGLIVSNRYATSNIAHQGAKFLDPVEKEKYIQWVYELEYKVHKIPKEDMVIYLYVPWEIGMRLTQQRGAQKYMEGKGDIHEENQDYRREVEKMYQSLAQKHAHWKIINCTDGGNLLPPQKIHEKVMGLLEDNSII